MARASLFVPSVFFSLVLTSIAVSDHSLSRDEIFVLQSEKRLMDSGQEKFDSLMESMDLFLDDNSVFWQLGNALDSMVGYCEAAQIDCSSVGQMALEIYSQKTMVKDWWKDDFGWWGELFVRLFDLTQDENFLDAALGCFHNFLGSKDKWKDAPPDLQAQQPPLFDNGSFNSDLKFVDNNSGFDGIENTITNVLFLKLGLRLFDIHYEAYLHTRHDNDAQSATYLWEYVIEQYRWFYNWFSNGLLNCTMAGDKQCLVEERVSKYKNGNTTLGYRKNRAWIADQGLIMSALLLCEQIYQELSIFNPLNLDTKGIDDKQLLDNGLSIAFAVGWAMVQTDSNLFSKYIKEDDDSFPFDDSADYIPGPGVYARNITFLSKNDEEYDKVFNDDDYLDILSSNAKQAIANPSDISDMVTFNGVASDLDMISTAISLDILPHGNEQVDAF